MITAAALIAEARRNAAQRFNDWAAGIQASLEDEPEVTAGSYPIAAIAAARRASEMAQAAISATELTVLGAERDELAHLTRSLSPWDAAAQLFAPRPQTTRHESIPTQRRGEAKP